MTMLTIPSKPIFPNKSENDRAETTARRRRLLEGNWAEDLEEFINDTVALDRRAIWGSLDTSSNVFKQGCIALSVLYNKKPSIGIRRDLKNQAAPLIAPFGKIDKSHYFEIMASVQSKTIGLREMLIRIDISDSNEILFRPVTPDMVFATAPAGDPMKANYLFEQRLRQNNKTGETFWTADIYDLRDVKNPKYMVKKLSSDGTFEEDMTKDFLGSDMSGENYPYRNKSGAPFLPWVFYHASIDGKLFSPYELSEVVAGSMVASTYYTYLKHLMFDNSFPQRYVASLQLAGLNTMDTNQQTQRMSLSTDPSSILCFTSDPDSSTQPLIGQFQAGMSDPSTMLGAIVTYERRLATQMGIDPASVQKVSSDPRSGYSIAMSMESMRAAQERYKPMFEVSDIEAIEKAAMISNAILGTDYPESGYIISYEAIELSEAELKTQTENIIALLDKGLISPVDAMFKIYPELSTEEQAIQKLRIIRQQKIEFL
tara:strand:+ start:2051 stop:3505 length:1455 start_codon:yes stop_codon:yes gene_type:complete